jgi:SAM-dependent MidA family methyltransferase
LTSNTLLSITSLTLSLSHSLIHPLFQVDWLTPVEIFAPWYGRALAHYMLELRKHDSRIDSSTPLSIVEIGGGTGTLAASILVRTNAAAAAVHCWGT